MVDQPSFSSCPVGSGKLVTQGQVFALIQEDAQASHDVVAGIISVHSCYACALFDPVATYSSVSLSFLRKNFLCVVDLSYNLCVITLVVVLRTVNRLAVACFVLIEEPEFFADLLLMELRDYRRKMVLFCFPNHEEFTFSGSKGYTLA